MRILLTGGFGFIGGRVAQYLQQQGHQIVLGSSKMQKVPSWLPQAAIARTDWGDSEKLEIICENIDVIIHTAGMNIQDCLADSIAAIRVNGLNTAKLVKAAVTQSVKRFIYLSTAHVYASPLVGDIRESTHPGNLHPYATSHLVGEEALMEAVNRKEIEGIVVRLSNAFGVPSQPDANCWMLLVNDLCRQAVTNNKLILRTSGLQQRDFISLNEVCKAMQHLITIKFTALSNGLINLGSGKSQTIIQMANLIQDRCNHVLGFKPLLQARDSEPDEMYETLKYNVDTLKKTGFHGSEDLAGEIDKLLIYCSTCFSAPRKKEL